MSKILTLDGVRNHEKSLIHTIMIMKDLSSHSSTIERDDNSYVELSKPHTGSKPP